MAARDFMKLKSRLQEHYGPQALDGYARCIRTVFTWAYEAQLIERMPLFGADFKSHNVARARRKAKRQDRKSGAGGAKMLPPETIVELMDAASVPIRACMLLGINCGFYAIDCSDLPIDAINFTDRVIDFERYKTGIDRICPLWDETAEALQAAISARPEPIDSAHTNRVFITRRGNLWCGTRANTNEVGILHSVTHADYLGQEFRRLFAKCTIPRPKGCGFSWLRHIFYSVARRSKNVDGVNAIMGHAAGGMTEFYLEEVELDDIRSVTSHVHRWLFGAVPEGKHVLAKIG